MLAIKMKTSLAGQEGKFHNIYADHTVGLKFCISQDVRNPLDKHAIAFTLPSS